MADDDPDDASPWLRDDWVADRRVPGAGGTHSAEPVVDVTALGAFAEPPPEDFEHDGAPSRSTLGRKVVAGAIVLALLVGSAGALLSNDGAADDPAPAPSTTPVDDRPPFTLEALAPTAPPSTVTAVATPSSEAAGDQPVAFIRSFQEGQLPLWVSSTIAVPENLAEMAPTEVVTLSQSDVLSVTEFPSGSTRSLDVSGVGAGLRLAVGHGTIVVFSSTRMIQISDLEPVVSTSVRDGVIFVQPWTGTGNFIVTTLDTGPNVPQQDWVLIADGTLAELENPFVDEGPFFSRVFSPEGDALVTAPGGVYAIGPDGATRRVSTGALLATGTRHWAIEECDESLRCNFSIIEWDTGTVTPGALDLLDTSGFMDPVTHISPDGRSIAFRGDTDGAGRRKILDVASGTTVEAGRISQLVYPDAWASDSSGVFVTDSFLQFVDRETGAITKIEGLDRIRTVATGAFAP